MPNRREIYARPIPQNPPLDGPVLLKDGRPAYLRRASADDLAALGSFLQRVSDHSMAYRFFGNTPRGPQVAERLIAPEVHGTGLSLVVTVGEGERAKIVGVGSYERAEDRPVAEVAFLVEDQFQGRGIGMLLLERLAMGAEDEGLERLEAVVMPENQRMLRIFTDSGYEIDREFEGGDILITFSIEPTRTSVERYEARDRVATVASLIPFFHPRSVAVIGASRDPDQIGHRVVYNLVRSRFNGPVYPVNPRAEVIASIPAYPSVLQVPHDIDLAIVAVPPDEVLGVVDECAEKGIRGLIVFTAGFAESGDEGRELQQKLVTKVRANGMRLIGPNCLGLINTAQDVRLHGTFVDGWPQTGRVAMSSQSGALGLAVLEYAGDLGLGFSSFAGIGNKADVSGNDLLQYWEEDPQTDVILLYLESFGNPRRFANLARRIGRKKPILAVKGGRTRAGQRAAGSHTAAAAATDAVVEAFFAQTGVVRCDTLEEMFDLAILLANQPLPVGPRVAVLSNSGGPAILCADACEANGLELPTIEPADRERLMEALPRLSAVGNPIDMTSFATADEYRQALRILLQADYLDAIIVMFTPIGTADTSEVARAVVESVAERPGKPVLANFMGVRGTAQRLQWPGGMIPSYGFPEAAARALGQAAKYAQWRSRRRSGVVDFVDIEWDAVEKIVATAARTADGWLERQTVGTLLSALRLPAVPTFVVHTEEEAADAAEKVGYPVVLRAFHAPERAGERRSDVYINLDGVEDVQRAFKSLCRRLQEAGEERPAALVQPMVPQGVDVVIRVTEEAGFGPVVALGLPASSFGLVRDPLYGIMPFAQADAEEMVHSLKQRLVEGAGGVDFNLDFGALEDVLLRLSRLVHEFPQVAAVELGPLRIHPQGRGCALLDARVRILG